jgi:tRNA-Thr(GGU) m(6)t(6)A37 methyltransferase TsaA
MSECPRPSAFEVRPIGVIHSKWTVPAGTPIQPRFSPGEQGEATVEMDPEYGEGLKDLDGFDRIWLVYWFDRVGSATLTVTPFMDDTPRGLFSTRAPCRPNPIGVSPVKLLAVEGCLLRIAECDILDGTPLLDIKPYAPRFDVFEDAASGWLGEAAPTRTRADERFTDGGQTPT